VGLWGSTFIARTMTTNSEAENGRVTLSPRMRAQGEGLQASAHLTSSSTAGSIPRSNDWQRLDTFTRSFSGCVPGPASSVLTLWRKLAIELARKEKILPT